MKKYYLGFDIGGTKCAAVLASVSHGTICIVERHMFKTRDYSSNEAVEKLLYYAKDCMTSHKVTPVALGISCGGPLDIEKGLILSPPNLPTWDRVPIVDICKKALNIPAYLQNDANGGALAEYYFGAGKGLRNMIFLTFGTGLGAGLILNGQLYEGSTHVAGEIGHVRLTPDGPNGHGKYGSVEGYCSGGGIVNLAYNFLQETSEESSLRNIDVLTAKNIATEAYKGDKIAKEVYSISGKYLGYGLSILIDLFNPDKIIIGGIFTRSSDLLLDSMAPIITQEALKESTEHCKIEPSSLQEQVGDYSAITIAYLGENYE